MVICDSFLVYETICWRWEEIIHWNFFLCVCLHNICLLLPFITVPYNLFLFAMPVCRGNKANQIPVSFLTCWKPGCSLLAGGGY